MSQQQEVELNDLPEEVLVTVFKQMDVKTLLQSSLVCKKWNKIIGQNSAIMMKFKLVVNFYRKNFQLSPEDFTRNYQMIKIIALDKDWSNLPTLMNRYSSLRVLEIEVCKTDDMEKLNNLLARITKLEKLSISMRRKIFKTSHVDVSHHSCLKSLTLISELTTLKFPEAAQLTSLRISDLEYNNSSELIDFLVGQESLEVLAIRTNIPFCFEAERALMNLNYEKLLTAQFSLKQLLLNWDNDLFGSEKNFLHFMNKFANTLEELYLEHEYQNSAFPESVYKMIFEKFRKLNTLKISIDDAPDKNEFFQNLCENISIRELIINGYGSKISIQGFIGKLPNIQTLDLESTHLSKNLVSFISNNLRMLKNLQVVNIENDAFEGASIPSLTTITIKSYLYIKPQTWKQIVAALPNIKMFNMQCAELLNHKNIGIITKGWPHLKHVMVGKGFKAISDLFLRNCKELKTLRIYKDEYKSYTKKASTSDFERAGIQLTFYADKVREFTHSFERPFKIE